MEPARGGQAGREEKGKENEQDRTKNKPKEVHREVSNGKKHARAGQDGRVGKWEAAGPTRQKKMRRRGAGGGAGGRGAGGGRRGRGGGGGGAEGAGQQNSKTTELQRGSRKAKARERNIGRKGSGAGPGGGRGNKTAKRRSFNEEAGKPKHANET